MAFQLNQKYDFSKATVKCDAENNPPSIIDKEKLKIQVVVPDRNGGDNKLIITNIVNLYAEENDRQSEYHILL